MTATIAMNTQAADLLAQAQAALAAIGLTIAQAADLQQAAYLVEDGVWGAVAADTDELLECVAADLAEDELREDRLEAIARAAAYLVQA